MPITSINTSKATSPSASTLQFTSTEPMNTKSLALLLDKLNVKSSTDQPALLTTVEEGELVSAILEIPNAYSKDIDKLTSKLAGLGYSIIAIESTSPIVTQIKNYFGPLDIFRVRFLVINGDTYLTDGEKYFMVREEIE